MPKFSNGRVTTSSILYNRGVPNYSPNFSTAICANYEILKSVYRYNKKTGRQPFTFFPTQNPI
jgi:hypothetical protein